MAEYVYNELRKAEISDSANNGETKPQISDSKDSDGSDKKASSKDSNDDRNTTYVKYGFGILILLYLHSNLKFIRYFNKHHLSFIFIYTSTVRGRQDEH